MAKISLFLTLLFCFIDVSSTFAYWMAEGKRRIYIRRGSKALFMTLEVLIPYVKYEISVTGCCVPEHCICDQSHVDDPGLGHIGLKIIVRDPDSQNPHFWASWIRIRIH
jgi:hypothetical protein